jgi:hypothetical protein
MTKIKLKLLIFLAKIPRSPKIICRDGIFAVRQKHSQAHRKKLIKSFALFGTIYSPLAFPLCNQELRENYMKQLVSLITLLILGGLLAACGTNATATPEVTPEVTAEATEAGTETTVQGTVVEVIYGIAFDGNNTITLDTEDGQITVLVMEGGMVPAEMRDQVCDKNLAANDVANELQAGDEIEVFGLLREDGVLAVCSDERFTISILSQAEGTAEVTDTGVETTIRGTITEVIYGITFDASNEIKLETENGEITVLVMESGFVPEDMRDQVCNKNEVANEVLNTLQAGDEIEVFGLLRQDGLLAVCSDARFTITVLNKGEGTQEANIEERPVVGTVVENNHGCEVDAVCYLLVETETEGQWTVVYGTGERLPVEGQVLCNVTSEYTQAAWDVEVGAEIEAFGRVRGENEIGLCYEGEYTLVVKN